MTDRRGEAWEDGDLNELRRLYAAGNSNREIAGVLHRTEAAISARISMLKRRLLLGLANPDAR